MKFRPEYLLLYAVTDRSHLCGSTLPEQVEAALQGGASMIQLREKNLPEEAFEAEAREVLALCRRYGVPLLINDDAALAAKIGADGVHVGQNDMDPREARALLGPDAIIGVTARTKEQALKAEEAGADYLGSGAVFGTSTKSDASRMDHLLFREITSAVSIPVAAIGGISLDNIEQLGGLGMKGFAIVSGIFGARDIRQETRLLRGAAERLMRDEAILTDIQKKKPLIQCITNLVTANDCANALLSAGASPTMAHHPSEMDDFSRIIDALVLNMGATESLEAMRLAGKLAAERRVPVVIDPVGCAGSSFRLKECLSLIHDSNPVCIRGNAAEIMALALERNTGGGVDSFAAVSVERLEEAAVRLSEKSGSIVAASGPVDYVVSGTRIIRVEGGSALYKMLTGSGCMMSALMGAYMAAEASAESAASCCRFMARCGERAETRTRREGGGMGSFHVALMDELSYSGLHGLIN